MTRNSTLKVAVLAASVLAVLLVAALLLTNDGTAFASPAAQGTGTAVATRAATVAAATAVPTRAATAVATARATAVQPAALPTTGDANTGGPNWLLLVGGALLVAGLMALLTLGNRAPQRR